MPDVHMPTESKAYVLDDGIDEADLVRLPRVDPDNPLELQPGDQGFIRVDGEDVPVEVAD